MLILPTGREDGFSLLEILIIMVIMAALAAINLPYFEGFLASIEDRGQLRKIEHLSRAVREMSISQQRQMELFVGEQEIYYQASGKEKIGLEVQVLSKSTDKIVFYPDGRCSGGTFSIKLQGGKSYSAAIDAITGRISWTRQGSE